MVSPDPHIPVLIDALIEATTPVSGVWIDATFGAGGYTRRLLEAGADKVIGLDRDPMVFEMAAGWAADYGARLEMVETVFSRMDTVAEDVDGVVLDLGVSSMQLDMAERGFSFMRDGPLDMRMGRDGPTAAELIDQSDEGHLADILHHYGEERAARRIARALVRDRPFKTTAQLADTIAGCLPRSKPGQSHPATRSFQAIRIAVNDEFGELIRGLAAAERVLKPGGQLAVVTFHSLEDRVVKRFLTARSDTGGGGSRYAPETAAREPEFLLTPRKAISPQEDEILRNPRARSARLRVAKRSSALPGPLDVSKMALPKLTETKGL
jgi:16S rRNA (cytosine1402-N4)-methyltransferase